MLGQAHDLTDNFAIQSVSLTTIKNSFILKTTTPTIRKTQLDC